jgi:hypothetical protein
MIKKQQNIKGNSGNNRPMLKLTSLWLTLWQVKKVIDFVVKTYTFPSLYNRLRQYRRKLWYAVKQIIRNKLQNENYINNNSFRTLTDKIYTTVLLV